MPSAGIPTGKDSSNGSSVSSTSPARSSVAAAFILNTAWPDLLRESWQVSGSFCGFFGVCAPVFWEVARCEQTLATDEEPSPRLALGEAHENTSNMEPASGTGRGAKSPRQFLWRKLSEIQK
ncbi:MAG: hypothetical protein ACXWGY_04530, partial [Chthoniobacterales bacterium]